MTLAAPIQRSLPLELSARCALVTLEFVRNLRGCDAESVLNCVGDTTHPKFLRWVFNVALVSGDEFRRELRFWKDEVLANGNAADGRSSFDLQQLEASTVIRRILGERRTFPRGEIEVQWTINATTIGRLVRARELSEVNKQLTRSSLAQFLQRRLQ
jgi:hypothetical protein